MSEPGELKELEEEFSQTECAVLDGIVWRKLDIWLLPLMTLFFLLAAVDRTNIANARVVGLQTSLAMSNYQFTMALTATSVPFIVTEMPFSLLLKYVGPNIMIPGMATSWGVASAAQGLVGNYSELLVCRVFVGMLEGGIFAGIVLYLSFFYPRKRLQTRIAIFFAAASLTGAFSGLLAAAIDHMDGVGGKPGWAWIFILEGLISCVVGSISFFILPRSPERIRFLTEKERKYVVFALKRAGSVSEDDDNDRFSWKEVIKAAGSPHLWLLAPVYFCNGAVVLGLAYFEPTIVTSVGYAGNRAQLMSVPPYAVSFVLTIISSIVSDRYQCRGYTAILFAVLQLIGLIMFYASTSHSVRYASLFFSVTGTYCGAPPGVAWLLNNSAPHTRRAAAVGVLLILAESGGLLSTWLLGSISPAPNYTSATITFISMSILIITFLTANLVYLWRQNRLKAERRMRITKEQEPKGLGDRSAWFVYSL